jgi:hypothetical protein
MLGGLEAEVRRAESTSEFYRCVLRDLRAAPRASGSGLAATDRQSTKRDDCDAPENPRANELLMLSSLRLDILPSLIAEETNYIFHRRSQPGVIVATCPFGKPA